MATIIKVTPELLTAAATEIEGKATNYQAQYQKLYDATNAMSASWTGKDNLAYTTQIEGFRDDFDKMYNLMTEYATFLKNAAKSYSETQDIIEKQAKTLRN